MVQFIRYLPVDTLKSMAVYVKGRADVGMAQAAADILCRCSFGYKKTGCSMPQAVEWERRETMSFKELRKPFADSVNVHRLTVPCSEYYI